VAINNLDTRYTEIAELVYITNKYYPGIQEFRINALVTNKTNETVHNQSSNVKNKNSTMLGLSTTTKGDTIKIKLPKEHTINYPDKFIPAGTKFIVNFIGGDISKPLIVGRIDE
jgi:hypothetical protein